MHRSSVASLACALCLTVPAAAGASEAHGAPSPGTPGTFPKLVDAKGPYGTTVAPGALPKLVAAKGPYGTTPAPGALPKLVPAEGPYGATPAPGTLPNLAAAKGPYGMTPAGASQVGAASPHSGRVTGQGDTDGWRVAAISEGALLTLLLLGSALLVAGRHRAMHLGV